MKGKPMKLKFYKKNFINQREVQLVLPTSSPFKLAFKNSKPDLYYQDEDNGWLADGYLVDNNTIMWFGDNSVAQIHPSKELQKTYIDQLYVVKNNWEYPTILSTFIKSAVEEYEDFFKDTSFR